MAINPLFSPISLRNLTFKNRIFVSPMCQYSAVEGMPGDWHFAHLASFAVGGAALVMTEATGVNPEGRITFGCTGIWNEWQMLEWKKICNFVHSQETFAGIQLAHAGRKSATPRPWTVSENEDFSKWTRWAPSPIPFKPTDPPPREMGPTEIKHVIADFVAAAERAVQAGFDVIEIHGAHGYLLHEFMSSLSNHRKDEYGGSLENRMRFPLQVVAAVRSHIPKTMPLFFRVSASDWVEGGWDVHQTVALSKELKKMGVDLVDVSSGGLSPLQKIDLRPHYQVPFAAQIKKEAGVTTGAVGMITEPIAANKILQDGEADAIFLARELLRDPHWPLRAAHVLGENTPWPKQYERAKW